MLKKQEVDMRDVAAAWEHLVDTLSSARGNLHLSSAKDTTVKTAREARKTARTAKSRVGGAVDALAGRPSALPWGLLLGAAAVAALAGAILGAALPRQLTTEGSKDI